MKPFPTLLVLLIFGKAIAQVPKIDSFSPVSGNIGTVVSIHGANFSPIATNNKVFFGGMRAPVVASSSTTVTVTVPPGVSYQPISVTTNGLTAFSSRPFNQTFPSELVLANSSFAFADSFATGKGASRIISCDFNNDGKQDLANINDSANTISVFRNSSTTGLLHFEPNIDFVTGKRPSGLSVGDIDGDGSPDIIVSNAKSKSVSVFRNTSIPQGQIQFDTALTFTTNTDPRGLAIADFDNDGKPDIAVITYAGGTVSILKNISTPQGIDFAAKKDIDLIYAGTSIAAADFNLDGYTDLVVPNALNKPVAFFKNVSSDTAIAFDSIRTGPITTLPASTPLNISVADFNNDGKMDIVSVGSENTVFQNTGTPGGEIVFKYEQSLGGSGTNPSLAIANFDNDAMPELVAGKTFPNSTFSVFPNKSTTVKIQFGINGPAVNSNSWPASLAIADFDADGRADIASVNPFSPNITLFKNQSSDVGLNYFNVDQGSTGTLISLFGVNLGKTEAVRFGGVDADSFRVIDSSHLVAYVGSGKTGDVSIHSATGSAKLPGFTFLPPPLLLAFSPSVAGTGDTIKITGTMLGTTHTVQFGNTNAFWFNVLNDSTILAVVDSGYSGNVVVKTLKGTAVKAGFVFVHAPVINAISGNDVLPGEMLTLRGFFFTSADTLKIAGKINMPFTIVSDSVVTTLVGGYSGGKIELSGPFGNGEFPGFYNGPEIDSLDYYSADANTTITIFGKRFANNAVDNILTIGQTTAKIVRASNSVIVAKVPVGGSFGPVSLAVNGLNTSTQKAFIQTFTNNASEVHANAFLPKTQISSSYNSLTGVSAADVNGDGTIDLAAVDVSTENMVVYKNSKAPQPLKFNSTQYSLNNTIFTSTGTKIVDITGDGKPEVLARVAESLEVFENISTKSDVAFKPVVKFPFGLTPNAIDVADFDGNGKPDVVYSYYTGFSILENTGNAEKLAFTQSKFYINFRFQDYSIKCFSVGDFNNDGKPDISVSYNHGLTHIYKNTSLPGKISFLYDPFILFNNLDFIRQACIDVDGNGKVDLVGATATQNMVVYLNKSSQNNLDFEPAQTFEANNYFTDFLIADFDGNGKPDFVVGTNYSNVFSILLNQSSPGALLFKTPINVDIPGGTYSIVSGDFTGDERPDIALLETNANFISLFSNHIGEIRTVEICPPTGNANIFTSTSGDTYQWQKNEGLGFVDIFDNEFYSGTNTDTLRLYNIPSTSSGAVFRCLVNNSPAESFRLKFTNLWEGTIDNKWENAANWRCGVVPDENTDVIITDGNITIGQNTIIKSLTVNPGANIHINTGVHFKIIVQYF